MLFVGKGFPFFVWPKEKPHAAKADAGLEGSMSCVDRREAIVGVTAQWRSWISFPCGLAN